METPILTRYLYHLTDVKFSLISCLLKSEDIKEVLFWASEIYYSGYSNLLYNIIWKIYYDFYAITNPLLESQINKLKSKKMNQTTICIVNKMKNLKIQETQNIKLQITPLDIFDENGLERCNLLKIDCEGAEYDIFYNTPAEYFDRIDRIRMEYHNRTIPEYNIKDLTRFLKKMRFEMVHKDRNALIAWFDKHD